MAVEWIRSQLALRIVAKALGEGPARSAIIRRCHGGLIPTRADRFLEDDEVGEADPLPPEIWPANGQLADEDWEARDFRSSYGRDEQWQAYAVQFGFNELMNLVPSEQRVICLAGSTVAGDEAWVSARGARRLFWHHLFFRRRQRMSRTVLKSAD